MDLMDLVDLVDNCFDGCDESWMMVEGFDGFDGGWILIHDGFDG